MQDNGRQQAAGVNAHLAENYRENKQPDEGGGHLVLRVANGEKQRCADHRDRLAGFPPADARIQQKAAADNFFHNRCQQADADSRQRKIKS